MNFNKMFERIAHPMRPMRVARDIGMFALFALAVYFGFTGEYQTAWFCIMTGYLLDLRNELDVAHECIHKVGALVGVMSMPGMGERIHQEMVKIEEALQNGQNPEDVLK